MVIQMNFKDMKDVRNAATRNIYDYILAHQQNNIFIHLEQKMNDMVT